MFLLTLVLVLLAIQYISVIWTLTVLPQLKYGLVLKILPLVSTLLFMAAMYVSRKNPDGFGDIFGTVMYIWLGAIFIYFVVCMAAMLLQITAAALKLGISFKWAPAIAFGLAAVISVISVINGFSAPDIKQITLTSPKVAEDITIAQISDSHFGVGVSVKRVEALAAKLKELNPDIIVFTGDIFENTAKKTPLYIAALQGLNPKYGKYGVLGNHEYYTNVMRNLEIWEKAGIIPLQNTGAIVGPLYITGVNDIRTSGMTTTEFTKILSGADKNKFNLVLSHTPLYYTEAAQAGADLMLSGHTHSGQIWPFTYLSKMQFKHLYGMYEIGDFKHYVTSGAFYWGPPMRFLTKNEVPLITIKHE